jgi:hypothetical protein
MSVKVRSQFETVSVALPRGLMGCLASERLAADPYNISRTPLAVSLSFFVCVCRSVSPPKKRVPRRAPETDRQHTMKTSRFSTEREMKKKTEPPLTRLDTRAQGTQRAGQKSTRQTRTYEGNLVSSFRTVAYLFQYVRPFGLEPEQVGFVDRSFILSLSLSLSHESSEVFNSENY